MPKTRSSPWYHYRIGVIMDNLYAEFAADERLSRTALFGSLTPGYSQEALDEMLHNISNSYKLKQMDFGIMSYNKYKEASMTSKTSMFRLLKKVGAL